MIALQHTSCANRWRVIKYGYEARTCQHIERQAQTARRTGSDDGAVIVIRQVPRRTSREEDVSEGVVLRKNIRDMVTTGVDKGGGGGGPWQNETHLRIFIITDRREERRGGGRRRGEKRVTIQN